VSRCAVLGLDNAVIYLFSFNASIVFVELNMDKSSSVLSIRVNIIERIVEEVIVEVIEVPLRADSDVSTVGPVN